jgi:hypothetical protein
MDTQVSSYHERPYNVIHGYHFSEAIREQIEDENIRSWPLIGKVDQFSDSTDLLTGSHLDVLRALYVTK